MKGYEPKLAFVGGADGLVLYDELCVQLKTYLHEQSRRGRRIAIDLLIEIDVAQKLTAPAMLREHFPTAHVTVIPDLAKKERVVIASVR